MAAIQPGAPGASAIAPAGTRTYRRRLLIDTDGGCDDAVAILLALRAQEAAEAQVQLVGMTSVFGNVSMAQATENIYTILRVFDALDVVPFWAGAKGPLVHDREIHTWPGHGTNGLGDASFLEGGAVHDHDAYQARVAKALQPQHAVQAIIDLSHRYAGELDIVALGPLTNIALALRMDPTLPLRVRSFTFMGGSCYGKGNATLTGEFNFICDPEAAHIALTGLAGAASGEVSCLCLPWEVSEAAALSWSEFDELTRGHQEHVMGDPTTQHALEAAFLKRTHAKYELQCRGTGPAAATANAAKKSSDAAVPAPSATASSSSAASASAAAAGDVSLAQAPAAADAPVKSDQLAALHEIPSIADLRAAGGVHAADPFAPVIAGAAATAAAAVDSAEYICCDSFAVACLLVPSLITRSERHHVQVLLQGDEQTRGMLAVDWYDKKPTPSSGAASGSGSSSSHNGIPFTPLTIVTEVHRERYLSLMRDVFQGAPTRGRQSQQKKQQQ